MSSSCNWIKYVHAPHDYFMSFHPSLRYQMFHHLTVLRILSFLPPTPSVWTSECLGEARHTAWEVPVFSWPSCSSQATYLITWFSFLVPKHRSPYTFSFLYPHFYLLPLCALLSPRCSLWQCHSQRTGHAPSEFPTPPSMAIIFSDRGFKG